MRALLLIFLISNMGFAQQIPILIQQKTANIAARYKAMPVYMKKVHCQIYDAIQKIDRSKKSIQQLNNLSHLLEIDSEGRIHVSLRTSEITPVLLKQLADNGFEIELNTANLNISPNHQMITGWVHYYQIETIAQISPIFHVRPVDRPMRNTGEVTTAGDYILRADEARQTFGVSGMGQKVGVLSDGIDHWDQVQATGDLPQIEVVRNRFAGDEGTAMLEIVYDLAPRAQLAFAD